MTCLPLAARSIAAYSNPANPFGVFVKFTDSEMSFASM